MNHNPFDHLREANPLPEDAPVYPPMTTADRIVGSPARRAWPAWALAGSLALIALVAGSAWLLWIRGGTREVAATSAPPTTAPATTAPVGEQLTGDAVIYLLVQDDGTQLGAGPYLIPVARPYAVLSHFVTDPVYETLNFLLVGAYPGEEQAGPALFSAIPEGVQLLGLEVADGIATVDLSVEFADDDILILQRSLAQVVFTLTRFPEITAVEVSIDGVHMSASLYGMGLELGEPFTRTAFEDLLPAVMIESPAYWASTGENPLAVTGTANVFEAVVSLELLDQNGAVLWEGTTLATCGTGCRGDFSVEVPYQVGEGQVGTLVAWETSMRDGSRTNVRQHPVWLNGSGEPTTTTLDPIDDLLSERYDLDKAIDDLLTQLEAIDVQLAALGPDEGADLRTHAAQLDHQIAELRDRLSVVYDELLAAGVSFDIPCSAEGLTPAAVASPMPGQGDLPVEVAALHTQIYQAARTCDWAALADLLDSATFSYSFGESGDPIGYWRRAEFLHYRPMIYIAGVLRAPFGLVETDEPSIYSWPSAHTYGSWTEVPEAEREALRPLYGDLDLASFTEFGGYLGFRVGISFDGETARWIYAIEGN